MIYADYNASAPLKTGLKDYLNRRLASGIYANPNALHRFGAQVKQALEQCRDICAKALGAGPEQVIFTSGASEGITTVFHSVLGRSIQTHPERNLLIVSGIEHPAVHQNAKTWALRGFDILTLPSATSGIVDIDLLSSWTEKHSTKIALVAVMAANNETGVVQPFEGIADACRSKGLPYFCDTTQFIGKRAFSFGKTGLDWAVLSGHKLGALSGTGVILAAKPENLDPLIIGGGQEKGLRGGTENYLGIESLAFVLNEWSDEKGREGGLSSARDAFEDGLLRRFPELVVIGKGVPRLPGTSLITYPGIFGHAVQIELEARDILVTTSAACSEKEPFASRVLTAMGIDDRIARGTIRLSVDPSGKGEEYPEITAALSEIFPKLKKIGGYDS